MDLTISIVSYNTKIKLQACLESIFQYKGKKTFEVIVVDNASEDGSIEMVKSFFPQTALILNSANLFFSCAHNQAFKRAKGKYVLILNSDTLIKNNTFDECLDYFENNSEAGALTCRTTNTDGSFQLNYSEDYRYKLALLNYTFLGKIFPKTKKTFNDEFTYFNDRGASIREVCVAGDANLWIRKEIAEKTGYYDERFKLYYTENDICINVRKLGHKIYFIPSGSVVHHVRQSVEKAGLKKISQIYYEDTIEYYKKYNGYFPALFLAVLIKITNLLIKMQKLKNQNIFFTFLNHPNNIK